MIFADAIASEYQSYLVALVAALIVYLGWRTTYVREQRLHPTAVLIIDNNRRRFIDLTATVDPVDRSSSSQSNYSNATEEAEIEIDSNETNSESPDSQTTTSLQSLIDDLSISGNSSSNYNHALQPLQEEIEDLIDDIGPRHILEAMDGPDTAEGLRRRRLAFYENERPVSNYEGTQVNRRENLNVHPADAIDNSHAENCTNENNENENISKTEIKAPVIVSEGIQHQQQPQQKQAVDENSRETEFRVKLKYLNDELRLVKGTPNEAIGDFKKRNFTVELAGEKLVRLVFNGHVLQPDSKTLKACGLFDNCVVHCLVHNKKPSPVNSDGDNNNADQDQPNSDQPTLGTSTFTDRNNGGVVFIYLGMVFIVLAMIFCWYCRFQYGHLFSWFSTTGLVLLTAIFLIIFPIIVLIERGVTT